MEKMSRLLGDGAGSFFESYERERSFGLRVNPLKAGERLPEFLSGLERIPWSREGFYYPEELRPGKHPLHEAGAYYIQEPSAQACAEALDPRPGDGSWTSVRLQAERVPIWQGRWNRRGFWCAMRSIRPGQRSCPRTSSAWGSETQWSPIWSLRAWSLGSGSFLTASPWTLPAPGKGCSGRMRMQGWNGARPR